MIFDTLMYAKRLEAAGMTRDQAEAQVNVIAEMVVDGVATKQDLALLDAKTQKEFATVRFEMADGFAKVSRSLVELEHRITIRLGGMIVASMTLTIAVLAWFK